MYHLLWYSIIGALQYIHLYLYLIYNSTIKITAWSTTLLLSCITIKEWYQTKSCNLYINNNNKKQLIIFICVFTAENFLLFSFLCMKYSTICMLYLTVKFHNLNEEPLIFLYNLYAVHHVKIPRFKLRWKALILCVHYIITIYVYAKHPTNFHDWKQDSNSTIQIKMRSLLISIHYPCSPTCPHFNGLTVINAFWISCKFILE